MVLRTFGKHWKNETETILNLKNLKTWKWKISNLREVALNDPFILTLASERMNSIANWIPEICRAIFSLLRRIYASVVWSSVKLFRAQSTACLYFILLCLDSPLFLQFKLPGRHKPSTKIKKKGSALRLVNFI